MAAHEHYGYNTKNFKMDDGDTDVFEGTVAFLGKVHFQDAQIDGLMSSQSSSTATTVAALKDDFNALLDKLKDSGLMEI